MSLIVQICSAVQWEGQNPNPGGPAPAVLSATAPHTPGLLWRAGSPLPGGELTVHRTPSQEPGSFPADGTARSSVA